MTGVVPIDRRDSWSLPTDGDEGNNYQAQLDVTDLLNGNLTLANKAYFEDYPQLQLEYAQRYYNDIDESYNFEDRFELRGRLRPTTSSYRPGLPFHPRAGLLATSSTST